MKLWKTVATGVLALAVLSVAASAQPAPAPVAASVKTATGTVIGVYLQLSKSAADMHAMQVRVGAGMEFPAWFYDKKDKNLGSYKAGDIVEIKYVTTPSGNRNRFDIREIRKVDAAALAAAIAAEPKPVITTDYAPLKAAVAAGDLAKGRALVEDMVKTEGGYQAFGDKLCHSGLYPLAQYCYVKAMGDGKSTRGTAYTARRSLVVMFQGPWHPDLAKVADGAYKGVCVGYIGPNTVTVTVKDHKITNVTVQSPDDRPLNSLQKTPQDIVAKQGIKGVDAVTGATITANAVMVGASIALKEAEK
jgi:uncharacterized protein with FMN-binding domain